MKHRFFFLTVFVALSGRPLCAEIMVAPTLEWLADHCIDSGVYVVTSAAEREDSDTVYSVVLTLKRALRGDPQEKLVENYSDLRTAEESGTAAVAQGHEFLVCFQHHENGEKQAIQLINLTCPQTAGFNQIAVTSKLEVLKNRKSILDAFAGRLKSHPTADPVRIQDYSKDNRLELPFDNEVHRAIYAGSSCYVRIPADLVGKQ